MTESNEQIALFQWAAYSRGKYPELELLHHIPNGGKRDAKEAARFKREGVLAGVSDVFLPVARGKFHGLYLEMKAKGGKLSDHQRWWIQQVTKQGYLAEVCFGWEEAKNVIVSYLEQNLETNKVRRIGGK